MQRTVRFRLLGAMAFLLVSGSLLVAFLPHSPLLPSHATPSSIRLLALGDSYTIGESVPQDQSWPMQLRKTLENNGIEVEWYKVVARTGWKCKELKEAIAASNIDNNYDLVGLLIGVNDFFQGRGLDEYRQRFQGLLDRAIEFAKGRKDRVFVLSIPDYAYTPLYQGEMDQVSKGIDDFNAVNKKITLAAGVTYIDITPISRQGLIDRELVADDGLHPSGKQYAAWVKWMEPTVLQMLEK